MLCIKPIELTIFWLPEGIAAITLWPVILYRRTYRTDISIRAHEFIHWYQALKWGVIPWYITYLVLKVFYRGRPIFDHPLEKIAYKEGRIVSDKLLRNEDASDYLNIKYGVR